MLHIKFRGNRSTGLGEEDSLRVLIIYVTQMYEQTFVSPTHGGST